MIRVDPFGAFRAGEEWGAREGGRIRNARAYQEGGLDAVADAAGRAGDMESMEATRGMQRRQRVFEDDQRQAAYERMETIAPWARNVVRATQTMDPERARAFLTQPNIQQRFLDFGLSEDQVAAGIAGLTSENPEERAQWAEQVNAAFTQHQNPEWELQTVPTEDGQSYEQRPVAIDPNTGGIIRGEGSLPAMPGEIQQLGSGGLWRTNPNAPNGYEILREPRVSSGGGGVGYRPVTPEEADMYGLPNDGAGYVMGPNGRPTRIPGAGGSYTDSAAQSAQYANRMSAADQTLSQLEDTFTSPEGVFVARTGFGNQEERQVRQAQREFVNAILRRESGAVISDSEFASAAQQYFPQPGDGPQVVAQKRAARRRAIQGLVNASQGAYDEWYGPGSGAELPEAPPPTGSVLGGIGGDMARGGARAESLQGLSLEELEALREELANGGR